MASLIETAASAAAQPVPGSSGLQSLKDFTDLNKLVDPSKLAGVKTDLTGMGEKLKDMGAKFKDSEGAKNLMNSLSNPGGAQFDTAFKSLGDVIGSASGTIAGLTGTGSGPLGVPAVRDFMEPIADGPSIQALLASVTADTITGIDTMVNKAKSLFGKAGVDYAAAPPINLGTMLNAATSLHKIGAEDNGAGASSVVKDLLDSSEYGEAINMSMAEGANFKAMEAAGIKLPSYNPWEGLPSAPENIGSAAAAKLLGGG